MNNTDEAGLLYAAPRVFCPRHMRAALGFTLIEVMVAVAILLFGIVAVYESFFVSLEAFGRYASYLDASGWANEKMWKTEEDLVRTGRITLGETKGVYTTLDKEYNWLLSITPADAAKGLFVVKITLFRCGRKKKIAARKAAYVIR